MNKIALALAAAFAASAAMADTVSLKDGDRLTGKIKTIASDGTVTFASKYAGEVKIKQADIVKLETDNDVELQFKSNDRDNEKGRVSVSKPGEYTFIPAGGKARKLDLSEVNAVNPDASEWHGSLNVSLTANRGNTYGSSASVNGDVKRRFKYDRVSADGTYYTARSGKSKESSKKTDDRVVINGQHDHFWLTKLYSYENLKFEHDRMQNLEWRFRLGLGLGYQWLENRKFENFGTVSFSQEFGLALTKERYRLTAHPENTYCSVRYAHHLTWVPVWVSNLSFFHNMEYLVDTDNFTDYQINTDVGAKLALTKAWQLMGKIEWLYNSNPADGLSKGDTRYFLGLGYTF